MDEDKIFKLILQSAHLMFKFNGVYAADNFPLHMPTNSFAIVNASPASSTRISLDCACKEICLPNTILCRPAGITSLLI